jgi:hypothetical protein
MVTPCHMPLVGMKFEKIEKIEKICRKCFLFLHCDTKCAKKWNKFWLVYFKPCPVPITLGPVGSHPCNGLTAGKGMASHLKLSSIIELH